MHLDAHLAHLGQGAVEQQALVEQACGGLHHVGAETARDAHRVVGGVDRHADAVEQTVVAHPLHAVPHGRAVRAEQIARLLHQDGVGVIDAQLPQRGAGLGFHEVGAAVTARGLHHHTERTGPRHHLAHHPFGAAADGRVEHRDAGPGGDLQDVAHLGFGRAATRIRHPVIEAELRGGQAKPGARI